MLLCCYYAALTVCWVAEISAMIVEINVISLDSYFDLRFIKQHYLKS